MKQLLKDTLELWITIVFLAILFGLPILVFEKNGLGVWQIIVCGLWISFWESFLITVDTRDGDAEENK